MASPEELRRIAAFLAQAADTMERMGAAYGHEHLCDRQPGFDDAPQWVVVGTAGQA
ncbi:Imm32 family immunity protein [Lysobacter sp. CA199]|uniref:Imm32 family immunity protein n=1 Tax=Lysobacter sp. CA199 TaxID=3455608 RepID=UPI003F8CF76A